MSQFAQYQQQLNALPVAPAPRGLFGGLRNFARQAQQPGGFVDRLAMFGAQMQDTGQLDGVNRAGTLADRRREQQQAQARAEALARLNSSLFGGQGAPASRDQVNDAFMRAGASGVDVGGLSQMYDRMNPRPQFYNTRAGVVAVQPDGTPQLIYANPEEAGDSIGGVPTGMIRNEDGSLAWAPGYVDAQLELGRGRRRTVIDNPVPSRAQPSGGVGRSSPSRRSTPAAASRRPWESYR